MNKIIYNKFGKDCGNIILDYKKDLDKYETCTKIFNQLYNKIHIWDTDFAVDYGLNQQVYRIYDKITITEFIYFLKYYINDEKKEIFELFTFKVNIRDHYNNFNKDYWLTHSIYEFKRFLNTLECYNYLDLQNIKRYRREITFNLFDHYIKKPKLYKKIYFFFKNLFIKFFEN